MEIARKGTWNWLVHEPVANWFFVYVMNSVNIINETPLSEKAALTKQYCLFAQLINAAVNCEGISNNTQRSISKLNAYISLYHVEANN